MGIPYAEVIGDPIAHSKSPLIHKFWLEKLGVGGDYRAVLVHRHQLSGYLEARQRDPDWRGCNVTMPHKRSVIPFLNDGDSRDPNHPFNRLGSVNLVTPLPGGGLGGASTDVPGFLEILGTVGLDWFRGKAVALIGAGGSAQAVAFSMFVVQPASVTVYNRSREKAALMLERVHLDPMDVDIRSLDDPLGPAQLVVNATPMGMNGFPPLPFDLGPLPDDAILVDLVYDPLDTELLQRAKARAMRIIDGIEMLVAQAALSFVQFFGHAAPREHDAELRQVLTR